MDFKLPFAHSEAKSAQPSGLAPLLARDMALMFAQLGVQRWISAGSNGTP